MATLAELRDMAAGLLGRHRLGQAIDNALKVRLDSAYDYVYADLKDRRIVTWSSAANTVIPNAVAPHVAALMAFDASSDIGPSQSHMQRILIKEERAIPAIKRISKTDYESLDEAENF